VAVSKLVASFVIFMLSQFRFDGALGTGFYKGKTKHRPGVIQKLDEYKTRL